MNWRAGSNADRKAPSPGKTGPGAFLDSYKESLMLICGLRLPQPA